MATSKEYIEFVCDHIRGLGDIRYKKMFGEYLMYIDQKPLLMVCDNTVFVKNLDCVANLMNGAGCGFPYEGAKEHYILDIEDHELCESVIRTLWEVVPLPKQKRKAAEKGV